MLLSSVDSECLKSLLCSRPTLYKIITPYGVKKGSLCKKSKILLEMEYSYSTLIKFHSISSKILLFLQGDPLFTPYGLIVSYSVYQDTASMDLLF